MLSSARHELDMDPLRSPFTQAILYRDWVIIYNPLPVCGDTSRDWTFYHSRYDPFESPTPMELGHAESINACREFIDAQITWIKEHIYVN